MDPIIQAWDSSRASPAASRASPGACPGQSKQSIGGVSHAARHGQTERQAAVPAAASKGSSAVGNVRAQRAADRAHNESVIASTDEQVAQALADEEAQVGPLVCGPCALLPLIAQSMRY